MTLNEYMEAAMRTAPLRLTTEAERQSVQIGVVPRCMVDLRHGTMGLVDEAGELTKALKRHDFYAKPIDWINVVEEAGDALWYVAMLCRSLGLTLEDIAIGNIAKLRARYPDSFSEKAAENRDVQKEITALKKELETKGEHS